MGKIINVRERDFHVGMYEKTYLPEIAKGVGVTLRHIAKNLFGGEPALLAYVELVPTKDNPSGFEWWSGTGPPYRITAGSVATVDIIVERARPITMIIPALRKLLSLEG